MAGLLSSALAGAVSGAGKAIQNNAQGDLELKRSAALEKVRHQSDMAKLDDQQQFTTSERLSTEKFKRKENQLDREALTQRGLNRNAQPTASMREAQWLVNQGIAPDIQSGYDLATSKTGMGQDKLDYLQDRISTIQDLRSGDAWVGLSEEQKQSYLDDLSRLQKLRNQAETRSMSSTGRGRLSDPGSGLGSNPSVDDILNSVLQ
ncbi:hypothetical protein [Modicisalibacter sp. 'Wilcox']|uniref:hypothetical protein n=1 Tax=Modicisalibacter sp. 'Wilcox' TaxID=2679914 RepID=UPI0013D1968D|nr:hypothetical protein [Modicisalibacter sp. 'Wilcox']